MLLNAILLKLVMGGAGGFSFGMMTGGVGTMVRHPLSFLYATDLGEEATSWAADTLAALLGDLLANTSFGEFLYSFMASR